MATCPDFPDALQQSITALGLRKVGLFAPSLDCGLFYRAEAPRRVDTAPRRHVLNMSPILAVRKILSSINVTLNTLKSSF